MGLATIAAAKVAVAVVVEAVAVLPLLVAEVSLLALEGLLALPRLLAKEGFPGFALTELIGAVAVVIAVGRSRSYVDRRAKLDGDAYMLGLGDWSCDKDCACDRCGCEDSDCGRLHARKLRRYVG